MSEVKPSRSRVAALFGFSDGRDTLTFSVPEWVDSPGRGGV